MKKKDIQRFIDSKQKSYPKTLTEYESKNILRLFDIPIVKERYVATTKEIKKSCAQIGFPVVIKGIKEDIIHKTEKQLVHTSLNSQANVLNAVKLMQKKEKIKNFLVQPMIKGKREFIAGMFKDIQFGCVIMFGLGGVLTEALKDIVFKIAPLSDADINDMFEQLSSKKLLKTFRNERAPDKKEIRKILKALSKIAFEYPDISQIDINPLIIEKNGNSIAVDGLIVLKGKTSDEKVQAKQFNIDNKKLLSCLYPESTVFIGASATPGKWGHMLLTSTLFGNYKGKIFLVNPRGTKIAGFQAYKSLEDIKEDIKLAIVTIPANKVLDIIPSLKRKNVKVLLLITSGFSETGNKGAILEEKIVKEAYDAGILILGPNTMGIANPYINFYCSAAHAYPRPGSTAIVSQSGNMGTQLLVFAQQQNIGIRAFVGSGNEAMISMEDYIKAFEKDELTKTIVLYIESIKNGRNFFETASKFAQKKPVMVLKGGRTDLGKRAAKSHTAAMASDTKVFNAACRQAGIIQVKEPVELLDLSAVFSSLPLPKGNKVGIITFGGGWGVITTDLCAENNIIVPKLPDYIVKDLNKILPQFWSHDNPLDIVGEGGIDIPKICLEKLLEWDECDAVIHLGIHGRRVLMNNMIKSALKTDPDIDSKAALAAQQIGVSHENDFIDHVIKLTHKYEKPILGVSLLTDNTSKTIYSRKGFEYKSVCFPSPERAVKALKEMCNYNVWKKTIAKQSVFNDFSSN